MKVFEIIVESRILKEETLWQAAFKAMHSVSELVKSGKGGAKELGEAWAKAAAESSSDLNSVIKIGEDVAKDLGIDSKIIADARKEAKASYKASAEAAEKYKNQLRPVAPPKELIDWVETYATVYQIAQPFYTYFQVQSYWQKELAAGNISQDKFNQIMRVEKGYVFNNLVATLIGNASINSISWVGKKITGGSLKLMEKLLTNKAYSKYYNIIEKMETAGRFGKAGVKAGLSYFLSTEQGRVAFAELILGGIAEKFGYNFLDIIHAEGQFIEDILNKIDSLATEYIGTPPGTIPGSTNDRPAATPDANAAGQYSLDMSPSSPAAPEYNWDPDTHVPAGFKRGPNNTLVPAEVDVDKLRSQLKQRR